MKICFCANNKLTNTEIFKIREMISKIPISSVIDNIALNREKIIENAKIILILFINPKSAMAKNKGSRNNNILSIK